MARTKKNKPVLFLAVEQEVEYFLVDREARNCSPKTLRYYQDTLRAWAAWLQAEGVTTLPALTAHHLRAYLLHLAHSGHNAGGVAHHYGAVRTFLRWAERESAPSGWDNPIHKVKPPKRPDEVQKPIELETFARLLAACSRTDNGDRDRALLLVLLDTGLRWQEVTDLTVGDVDGEEVFVRRGKGRKSRVVFLSARTRRALTAYLRRRGPLRPDAPLWATQEGGKLSRAGIGEVVRRRAQSAGIKRPGMHEFRRAFAVNYLRNGGDLETLRRLLGHSSMAMVMRYLDLVSDDVRAVHAKASPVSHLRF